MAEIRKCKYAGDPSDEGCKNCDGIKLVEGKNTFNATECGGYEPEEEKQVKETITDLNNAVNDTQEIPLQYNTPIKGITSIIRAESGVSREIKGVWYKFMYCEERVLPEGADLELEKQALWDEVNSQVDAQINAVLN